MKPLRLRHQRFILGRGKLPQKFFLFLSQFLRHFDQHLHKLVTATTAAQIRQSLALELDYFAMLRSGKYLQHLLAFERRHFKPRTQCRLGKTDRHLAHQVIVVPGEHGVVLHLDGSSADRRKGRPVRRLRPPPLPAVPFRRAQPAGHFYRDCSLHEKLACPATVRAMLFDHLSPGHGSWGRL